jgi:hypothetical protein
MRFDAALRVTPALSLGLRFFDPDSVGGRQGRRVPDQVRHDEKQRA